MRFTLLICVFIVAIYQFNQISSLVAIRSNHFFLELELLRTHNNFIYLLLCEREGIIYNDLTYKNL